MANVTIAYEDGTVFCTPDKGNVRVPSAARIVWRARQKDNIVFRLVFHREPFQGTARPKDDWPFSQSEPPRPGAPPSTSWTAIFDGQVLEGTLGVYEYLVEVKPMGAPDAEPPLAVLDPMIIIGS
jgi:hypothetical protein